MSHDDGRVAPAVGTSLRRVKIAGLSTYVPPKVLTNDDLEKPSTPVTWILPRNGIRNGTRRARSREIRPCEEAAIGAMRRRGSPGQLGSRRGTTTPDTIFPSNAAIFSKDRAHNRGASIWVRRVRVPYALTTACMVGRSARFTRWWSRRCQVQHHRIRDEPRAAVRRRRGAVVSLPRLREPAMIGYAPR